MKTFFALMVGIFILTFIGESRAQTGICSSSLIQATVSNLNSQIASYMPTLSYDPANNQFIASIFNNVQVLSQSQCANLIGNSAPTPGITSFSIYLSCTGPENNGNGITGGIQLPVTNVSTTAILNTVNIPVGSTYSSIPIKPHNPQASLSNRQCVIQLQATLYAILGGGYCQACYNVPIVSINHDTGSSGDSQPCEFFDLTCYNNFGILWRSTWLWCVVIMGVLVIAILTIFPVYGLIYLKRVRKIQFKEIESLKEANKNYLLELMTSEKKRLADYSAMVAPMPYLPPISPSSSTLQRERIEQAPQFTIASAAGKKSSRRAKQQPMPLPPPQLITITDEDESSESTDEDDNDTQQLLPQPPSPPKQPRTPKVSTAGPSPQPYQPPQPQKNPITQPKSKNRLMKTGITPKPPSRQQIEKRAF